MKNAWQIALLIAFVAAIPYIGSGCSSTSSSKLGNSAAIYPDGSGRMTLWMGGTRPAAIDEWEVETVSGSYSFVDYHQDDATYDVTTRITAQGLTVAGVGGVGILQFPSDASGFSATYDDYQGHAGALTVTAGLASVPITPTRTLAAEAGNQLVVVQVPPALVPESGQPEKWYENQINFTVNPTRTIQVKAVMAATVSQGGTIYYLPMCPVVSTLADVPAMAIELGNGPKEFRFPHLKDLPHPGGIQVYDVKHDQVYASRYFPRLGYAPGTSTEGLGFVNTGSQAIQATFHAYGASGAAVATSAPMTWPAKNQGAYQAEGVLTLTQATDGWVEARLSRGEMLGFFLTQWFPGGNLSGLDGASVFTRATSRAILPRVQMLDGYTTELRIVNTSPVGYNVAYQQVPGPFCGSFALPARGMMTADLAACGAFDGALYLEGTSQFIAHATIRHGNDCVSSVNAIPFDDAAETLYAPHIVLFPGVYSTSINLYNGNATSATVQLSPYNADGTPMASPFNTTIPGGQVVTLTDTELGLPAAVNSDGWLKITSPGKPLIGCITFGDPTNRMYESTLPLQRSGTSDLYYAQVATGDVGGVVYGTGIAVVNPSETASVQITIEVHKSDGSSNGNQVVRTLAPKEKYVRQLSQIEGIGALQNQASGYIHISATGPVLSFELFFDQSVNFLSAVEAQH
jgi:hypothetical protein